MTSYCCTWRTPWVWCK